MKINRQEFFLRVWKLFLGLGASAPFIDSSPTASAQKKNILEDSMAQKTKFIHNWVSNLLKIMDEHLDEKKKFSLLEECGRACAESHVKAETLKHKGSVDSWLGVLKKWVGSENVQMHNNGVRVMYSKCLCPLVQDRASLLSKTYCNCSRGWLKETFETVLERPVKVEIEDTIMQGCKKCRFLISWD
jgi:predicted hydrocarbon binding protein